MVLVIIGPDWVTAEDEHGKRRLDDPNDFVRLEVEVALRADMPVIPVLVSNARMPVTAELPPSMRSLVSRNGMPVRPDPDFNNDMNRLFAGLDHLDNLLKPKIAKLAKTELMADAKAVIVAPPPEAKAPQENSRTRMKSPEILPPELLQRAPRKSSRLGCFALIAGVAVLCAGVAVWQFVQNDTEQKKRASCERLERARRIASPSSSPWRSLSQTVSFAVWFIVSFSSPWRRLSQTVSFAV